MFCFVTTHDWIKYVNVGSRMDLTTIFPCIVSWCLFQFKFSHLDWSIQNQIPNAFICLDHFILPILAFTKLFNHKPSVNKLFQTDHTYENFLDKLPSAYLQKMINFRMCNNYLPIEKLRWAGIDRDHRKCNLCDKRDIGDEFHYLLSCSFFANTRRGLLPPCYIQHPNCIVFKNVLNEKDELKLTNTCTLFSVILK